MEVELREIRDHGDIFFPLTVYFVILTPGPSQQTVNHHWHTEAEYVLVTNGSVEIQVGTRLYRVHTGQGILINPEEVHAFTAPDDGTSECYAIVFNLELLSSASYDRLQRDFICPLLEKQCRFPTFLEGQTEWEQKILSSIKKIVLTYEDQSTPREMIIKAHLYLILAQLILSQQIIYLHNKDTQDDNITRLKIVLTYIDKHYHDPIRLSNLAGTINISEGHFCRFFKLMTHKTPVQYINDFRMNRAARLLQETNNSVMEIAMEVGFDNLSYFVKVFRRSKRCTPSKYRQLFITS